MIASAAHNFRWRIESHGLRIEQGGGKSGRVKFLDPGGNIDQQREAGSVAFGKTVGAEALDLLEACAGEFFRISTPGHTVDELTLKISNGADISKSRHGAT